MNSLNEKRKTSHNGRLESYSEFRNRITSVTERRERKDGSFVSICMMLVKKTGKYFYGVCSWDGKEARCVYHISTTQPKQVEDVVDEMEKDKKRAFGK